MQPGVSKDHAGGDPALTPRCTGLHPVAKGRLFWADTMSKRAKAAETKALLEGLENKLTLVRDRVAAVVLGFQTGFYLHGEGGLGKSYTVLQVLRGYDATYRLFNSRMTAKGLFKALEKAPSAVHVLEDMERLTRDRDAQGVLRSALHAQPGHDRIVTWTTATGGEERFPFSGGVIMIANTPLADLPELRALATRIAVHKLEVTDAELEALMRKLAAEGHADHRGRVDPANALTVAEHVIAECRAACCPLDLRLYVNSLADYLQWDSSHARCGWRDLVSNRVRHAAAHFREEVEARSREERLAHEREIVREICRLTPDPQERVRLWCERTHKSQPTFYRRLQEVNSKEFD